MNGMPSSWSFMAAAMICWIGRLKNAWCMYFSWFCLYGMVYKQNQLKYMHSEFFSLPIQQIIAAAVNG